MDNLDATIIHDLFPLSVGLVSEEVMLAPDGVPALDEAEDGVGIDVVGEGAAEFSDKGLRSADMKPRRFGFEEVAVEDTAAVIVQ